MGVNELIEFCLVHEKDIAEAVSDKRADSGRARVGGGGHCFVSDPTCTQALHNITEVDCVEVSCGSRIAGRAEVVPIRHPERWLRTVGMLKAYFLPKAESEAGILRLKQQRYPTKDIMEKLGLSKSVYYAAWYNLLFFAKGVATGLGLLNPRH